jgi:hypothetical protein
MAAARKTPSFSAARGAITWVGLALLLGLLAGSYLAWVWVPVFLADYDVKMVVRQIGNEAVKDPNDSKLLEAMVTRIRALEQVESRGPDGRTERRPAVELDPADVTWERGGSTLRVAFEYERTVPLPLLDRSLQRVMSVDLVMDVSRPSWGTAR